MKIEEVREQLWAFRQSANKEANARKESNLVWAWLQDLYRKFGLEERELADQVLIEWVLSNDENVRYDALVLIGEFKIADALPALEELGRRLSLSTSPGAPYERKKVDSILQELRVNH